VSDARSAAKQDAAEYIQGAMRGTDERWWAQTEEYENHENAAMCVQGGMRGKGARDAAARQRWEEEELARQRLAGGVRGRDARLTAAELHAQQERENEAARRIQSSMIGHDSRLLSGLQYDEDRHRSAEAIQGAMRGKGMRGELDSIRGWSNIEGLEAKALHLRKELKHTNRFGKESLWNDLDRMGFVQEGLLGVSALEEEIRVAKAKQIELDRAKEERLRELKEAQELRRVQEEEEERELNKQREALAKGRRGSVVDLIEQPK